MWVWKTFNQIWWSTSDQVKLRPWRTLLLSALAFCLGSGGLAVFAQRFDQPWVFVAVIIVAIPAVFIMFACYFRVRTMHINSSFERDAAERLRKMKFSEKD